MNTLSERIEKRLLEMKADVALIEKWLSAVRKLNLKEGDFCFHPELGNGIIKKLCAPENVRNFSINDLPVGRAKIYTATGEHEVGYKDLIPVGEMGQILYDKRFDE